MADREWDNRTSLITDPPDGQFPPLTPPRREARRGRPAAWSRSESGPRGPGRWSRRSAALRALHHLRRAAHGSRLQQLRPDHPVAGDRGDPPGDDPRRAHRPDDGAAASAGDASGSCTAIRAAAGTATRWSSRRRTSSTDSRARRRTSKLTERYTRVSPDFINWEITVDDPDTWTQPWTFMIRLKKTDAHIYEYACHEGNHSMVGILAGARRATRPSARRPSAEPTRHRLAAC